MDARETEFLHKMAENQRQIFADPEARRFHSLLPAAKIIARNRSRTPTEI